MNFQVREQASTEEFRSQVKRAVETMNRDDLSHVEVEGVLVVDGDAAELFLNDARYRHIGSDRVDDDEVQVFLFVAAD